MEEAKHFSKNPNSKKYNRFSDALEDMVVVILDSLSTFSSYMSVLPDSIRFPSQVTPALTIIANHFFTGFRVVS